MVLAKVKELRDSIWWEVVKQESYRKRRRLGLSQWKPGQTANFEDMMVSSLGIDWRSRRDSSSKAEWKVLSANVIDSICEDWGLPPDPRRRSSNQPPHAGCALNSVIHSSPRHLPVPDLQADCPEERLPEDDLWLADRSRFRCIVDNQVLARLVNGEASIGDESYRPILQSITRSLLRLIEHHRLHPYRDWDNPVQWRPRSYNKRADSMCNLILDGRDSFEIQGDNVDVVLSLRPRILIQSDGGCRNQGTSALGYAIYGIIFGYGDLPLEYYTLAVGGARVDGNLPSLEMEARALDLALYRLNHFLTSHELGQSS